MAEDPPLHVVLYHPEIPQNTGNIGRLCVGVHVRLHVVHPIGFSMSERAVRRAGLDYWKHVDLVEHLTEQDFWGWAAGRRVFLLSTHATTPYTQPTYREGDVLVFGRETKGLPEDVKASHPMLRIPMDGPVRSLNLSNSVAVVVYAALQDVRSSLF
jgi:tRNA (cytidine/uridine-2'-O-)-methyltransferase